MAVFTSNQVNHVYVANAVQSSALSAVGDIMCKKTAEGELYFVYKNGDGGIIRSDLIPIKNIMWARAVSGNHRSQKRKLKKYTITLPTPDSGANGSDIGKTFGVNLEVKLHEGIETVYRKQAFALVKSGNTQENVTDTLKTSFDRNFEKDDYVKDLFTIKKTSTSVTTGTGNDAVTTTTYHVIIFEKPQSAKYKPGLFANNAVDFVVTGDEDINIEEGYATVNDVNGSGSTSDAFTIGNSYDIADLEYFALGERGDLYRNIGWPNSFPSKTIATYGDNVHYNLVQVHFAFTDSNEGVQKSEKDITIAIAESSSTVTKINALLSQIAFNVLGAGGSGHGGSTGNDAFDLADTKVNVLDIPGGKKTELS